MAPFSALRPCQNVYLVNVGATGIVTEVDGANHRVKVDYTLRDLHRSRVHRHPEPRTEWFAPSDLALFYWVPSPDTVDWRVPFG